MRTRKGLLVFISSILFLIVSIFSFSNSYSAISADTNAVAYFPMHVGNVYVYNYTFRRPIPLPDTTVKLQSKIPMDTVINNRRYYFLLNFPMFSNGWYRVDSITGSLYKFDSTNSCPNYFKETFLDSLAALPGDSSVGCGAPIKYKCTSISLDTIFSSNTIKKVFHFSPPVFPLTYTIAFTKRIGVRSYAYSSIGPGGQQSGPSYFLVGCTVNNITYGDTTFSPPLPYTQITLISPDPWTTLSTSGNDTSKIVFSWNSTVSNSVKYNWKIKRTNSNSYLYFRSDSLGYARKFTIRKSKLDSIANSFGLIGDSVQCAWSCSAKLANDSANGEVRVLTIKANSVGINNISAVIPFEYKLFNNYPNPFNPVTNIKFDIPQKSFIVLKIYDVIGKELAILINEKLDAGSYIYQWGASEFPSGVYFYKIEANNFIETKRMVLIK